MLSLHHSTGSEGGEQAHSRPPAYFLEGKSEAEIWDAFRQGNEGAFNHIYRRYFQEMVRYGHRLCTNSELIKDSIQDLFIELRAASGRLSPTTSIKYYLYKALRYKLLRNLEKDRKWVLSGETSEEWHFEVTLSHETLLIEEQISEEQRKKLEKSLQALTLRQKEALFYFYYEAMSYEQVAGIMQLGHVKSARNLIYKAIDTLRREWKLLCVGVLAALLLARLLGLL